MFRILVKTFDTIDKLIQLSFIDKRDRVYFIKVVCNF